VDETDVVVPPQQSTATIEDDSQSRSSQEILTPMPGVDQFPPITLANFDIDVTGAFFLNAQSASSLDSSISFMLSNTDVNYLFIYLFIYLLTTAPRHHGPLCSSGSHPRCQYHDHRDRSPDNRLLRSSQRRRFFSLRPQIVKRIHSFTRRMSGS